MMEVKLGVTLKHLNQAIKKKLKKVNIYYLIWIVIHYVHHYVGKFHQYFIEYVWDHLVVKYIVAVVCNYYYNSRIYYNFYHYYYHYYSSSKKNDQHSACKGQKEEDGVMSRKGLVSLEDYLEQQDIINVIGTTGTLSKYPKHIAFSVLNFQEDLFSAEFGNNDNNNKQSQIKATNSKKQLVGEKEVRAICRLICWSWISQARVVSLYDYDGITEEISSQIKFCLHNEIEKTIRILKKCQPRLLGYYEHLPKIEIHNVGEETCVSGDRLDGAETPPSDNTLHICMFSRIHGRGAILKTVNKLTRRQSVPTVTSRKQSSFSVVSSDDSAFDYDPHGHHRRSELKESKVNAILSQSLYADVAGSKVLASTNAGPITEPDLLLVVGNLKSTMGFLPWNLRLTEIHWIPIPELLRLDSQDFITVLQKYSRSQQRFGT